MKKIKQEPRMTKQSPLRKLAKRKLANLLHKHSADSLKAARRAKRRKVSRKIVRQRRLVALAEKRQRVTTIRSRLDSMLHPKIEVAS